MCKVKPARSGTNSANQINKNGISKGTHRLQTINVQLRAVTLKKGMNTPHEIYILGTAPNL